MKRLIFAMLLLCLSARVGEAGIYRNNTKNPTAADSIVMECALTSSSVVNQRIATNDYFLVTVSYPNGDSAWTAKIDSSDARVREVVRTSGTITNYEYHLAFQVSDVDGDGREGVYKWEVVAVDSSGPSHSKYFGTMPVYNQSFYKMMDSVTAYLTEEFTNIIASDRGKVLVPTERTDGAYPTNAGRWKIKTGAGFGSGDSVNTNSKLDTDLDGDVDASDASKRLIIDGDSTICLWVGANSTTHDTTTARCLIDTTTIDARFFSNISFWAYVDMDHNHEGFCPGNTYSNSATDGDTPLKFIRVMLSSDTALSTYYYKDFVDTTVVRGWNKFVIARSDFLKVGSIVWPVADTSTPLKTVGFMVATDSVAGSSGMRDIRLMIDDIRINKRAKAKFMFRFDDGHYSQYQYAYHVFQDFPFRPTSNVCAYTIDLGHTSSNLDTADLRVLYEDGWDIANHGWYAAESEISGSPKVDSLVMAGTSLANDRFIINRNQSYLLDHGFKRGAGFFVYPFDAYDSTAIAVVSERHDFATGGKVGGFADHVDEIPERARAMRFTFPYMPWTSNTPEIDIDTVKGWISKAIERGVPLLVGAHSFKGHLHITPAMTVSHASGSSMNDEDGFDYSGTNAPVMVADGAIPDDTDYLLWNGDDGANANAYVVCSLNTASTWYVQKGSDNNWVDTVTIQWRVRGSATTTNDSIYLVIDTSNSESLTNIRTVGFSSTDWTTYTAVIRRTPEGVITGNDFNAGIKLKNTLGASTDTICWSWLHVEVGDDSGTVDGYGTQMDSSYLRAICNELVAKQGLIDCVTLSEYFRTQGSGGRLTQIAKNTLETRDSTIIMAGIISGLEDTIDVLQDSIATLMALARVIRDTNQAALDTLQNQDNWIAKASELQKALDSINAVLDTLQLHDNWVAKEATLSTLSTTLGNVRDTVNAILDTLQLQDNWGAKEATLTTLTTTIGNIRDTVNGIIDTLQLQDNWAALQSTLLAVRDTVNAVIDSLQLQDDWVAKQSVLAAVRDTVNAIIDSIQTGINVKYWAGFTVNGSEVALSNTNAYARQVANEVLQRHNGAVSGTSTTTKIVSSALSEADDYWNDNMIVFWQGPAMKQVSGIRDFFDTGDSLVIWPPLSIAPNVGDSFYIFGVLAYGDTRLALGDSLDAVKDSLQAALDTLQNHDDWVAKASELVKAIDSINGVLDTLQNHDNWVAQQAVLTATRDTANAILDSLQNSSSTLRTSGSLAAIIDTVNAILDTVQNQDNWIAKEATLTSMSTVLGAVRDTVNALMDSIQLHDNWVAKEATLATLSTTIGNIRDTVNASIDTLQNQDNWVALQSTLTAVRDTVNAIIDTTQNQDGWIAQNTILTAVRDTTNAILDTLQLYDGRLALASELQKGIDSTNAILDTLQNGSSTLRSSGSLTALTDSVNAILDTLQLYDGRWALASDLQKALDSANAILDTLQLYDGSGWLFTRLTQARDTAFAALDTLQNSSSTLRGSASLTAVTDSLQAVLDTLQNASSSLRSTASIDYDALGDTVRDALGDSLVAMRDSIQAILDTLQLHDNWVARQATLQLAIDSVNAALDSLQLHDDWVAKQATLAATQTTVGQVRDTVNATLDTLQNNSSTLRSTGNLTALTDTVNAILDTLQLYDTRLATATELQKAVDSVNAILDTLQLQDNWAAKEATLTSMNTLLGAVRDTANAILDSLQLQDNWSALQSTLLAVRDTVNAIIDTTQNQDNWIAKAAELQKALDTVNAALDTLQNTSSTLRSAGGAGADTLAIKIMMRVLLHDTLDIIRDSLFAVIDSLQNNSSTLRSTAGIDYDALGDTIRTALGDTVPAYAGTLSMAGSNKNVVFYVIDTAGVDDTLPGVTLSIKNSSQTANVVGWTTSGSPPRVTFGLMSATSFVAVPSLHGYAFTGPFPFTTTAGAAPDTIAIKGFDFDPGTPAEASVCRVFGWIRDVAGAPVESCQVNLRLMVSSENIVVIDTSTGNQVADYGQYVLTDSAGYFELDRIAGVMLYPPNLKYEYSAFKQGVINRTKKNVAVPNEASKQIDDLIH